MRSEENLMRGKTAETPKTKGSAYGYAAMLKAIKRELNLEGFRKT